MIHRRLQFESLSEFKYKAVHHKKGSIIPFRMMMRDEELIPCVTFSMDCWAIWLEQYESYVILAAGSGDPFDIDFRSILISEQKDPSTITVDGTRCCFVGDAEGLVNQLAELNALLRGEGL